LYDIGFPLVRSWLYGLGGFIVVIAAFAIGFVASSGGRDTAEVDVPAPIVADESADDVIVVRPAAARARFPAFAPEGVIIVQAPNPEERTFAAADTVSHERATVERATSGRRGESAERRARASVRRPVARDVSSTPPARELAELSEGASPEADVDEPRQDMRPTRNEAPAVREAEYPGDEPSEEASDNRSWYGSAEYRREVAERRRAEREARRRRDAGW
jgi:hypothetical protein